ncbi:hypothetical protein QTP70_014161, partial [Hemibagrus guttatus]
MHEVLREFLHKSVLVYIDDILIYSRSMADHRQHVAECTFHQPSVQFLEYNIDRSSVRMDERKITAVKDWPIPTLVDASTTGVGAVLSQQQGNPHKLHPCAFFSRKLNPAEVNYDIGNWELLAIKLALEEWRPWLEGAKHPFMVLTDHKNLDPEESTNDPEPIIHEKLFVSPITWSEETLPESSASTNTPPLAVETALLVAQHGIRHQE